ncbi:hypothetical protein DTO166G4_5299 [Paecilomyces variotii]|nr:hypothetical protein DTO166G4_5299 [Paecilomyces variotii]KAJ9234532.1 hypothetical protein DTO166G5_5129 [Paecilomyces variotii]KAJ9246874.1 hypothetical protein DTO207G8_8549 [Paecilomyces variotii]KAJ9265001.1 hypothetical protein DTO195F2_2013 [Paecilomyces variotii]KAJ9305625.1 hypothetical protein DTO217A2_4854 [Paecilomyces variotii]
MAGGDLGSALNDVSGAGQRKQGISITTFVASLATGIIVFAIEFLLFLFLKGKLTRIYQPRTYLVPDRERTRPSPPGLVRWIAPVFGTSNSEFIQKCGLDAFFFLRYLRMLLKIFVPLAILLLPILIPLNKVGGRDQNLENPNSVNSTRWNVTGLDQLAWGNVDPHHTHRYWAHLVLAVIVVIYVCAVFFDEMRGYIRLRQAYLTSPQHRLRASATTVLVTAIPQRWLSVEMLDSLFDVFPGGIRNIWINRNFDELSEKVKLRNQLALALEDAETALIKKCKKAQIKMAKVEAKKAGKSVKEVANREQEAANRRASHLAMDAGVSSGNPHQVAHTIDDALAGESTSRLVTGDSRQKRGFMPVVGNGFDAVGHGVGKVGQAVFGEARKVEGGLDEKLARMNGFVPGITTGPDEETQDDAIGDGVGPGYHFHRTPSAERRAATASNSAAERQPFDADKPHESERQRSYSDGGRPFWKRNSSNTSKRSAKTAPDPHGDEQPLTAPESPRSTMDSERKRESREMQQEIKTAADGNAREGDQVEGQEYPIAYNEEFEDGDYGEPLWKKYIKEKDRETMRLPIFGLSWMPSLPLVGKKVDTINYCRKEVARLNLEIEMDQQEPEKFPLMNSAFIQFNHQVAAHMACQAVSHHIPKQMAPRIVEISPDDVIWDNMSIKWWERYLRTFGVIIIVCAMVVGWAFPVAFTGLLSQLAYLEGRVPWLAWLSKLPNWFLSAIQGILPPLFLAILMAILPIMLRFLSKTQGVHTGMAVELTVQNYYFAFLFVQLFLVVAVASSFSTIFNSLTDITSWPNLLAENIPKSSNYFFSYMILQALSVSAGALVQIWNLISWFILAPILDNTARMKWARTTNLNQMQWGTFFPVYTTLASIGLIYCVIAPLILVFNVITFSLFWFVYRYNTLYVTKFRFDTGGLLFPKAINQLFTGIYVMELSLIGMFFLVRDANGDVACDGQAICMIVVMVLTVGFQYLFNEAFHPLIRYLPITLEDDAVRRDEEFARAQRIRLGMPADDDEDEQRESIEHELADRERAEREENERAQEIEMKEIEAEKQKRKHNRGSSIAKTVDKTIDKLGDATKFIHRQTWADRTNNRNRRSKYFAANSDTTMPTIRRMREKLAEDQEAQAPPTNRIGQALFSGIHDELEDLTPDERDQLVQRAFQHEALRAKRPVIWIPRDDLGVSDDEIYRTQRFSKHIWISNEYQALDGKGRTIFSRSPPDFSEVDLIQL